jgi:hypothetical protein
MKVAINACFGGFSVSDAVLEKLGLKPLEGYRADWTYLCNDDLGIKSDNNYAYRADPRLIKAIEDVGPNGSAGHCAELKIVEIPDGVDWMIDEYDGYESIHEKHRIWR